MNTLISTVVPDNVAAAELYTDPPDLKPLRDEEPLIARSVAKRRNEFITVRYCARLALGQLGVAAGPILKGEKGEPCWPDGVVGSDGQIRLPKQWGWFAAYRHYWFDQLRSNLVLSTAGENNPAGAPAPTNKSTRSAHINLIWSPVANSDLGLEYIYADRETEDGLKQ